MGLTACSSLTQSSTTPLKINNYQVPCAVSNIPSDISTYLTDNDLKGVLTPNKEELAGKSKAELLNDYKRLYSVSKKQMNLFLQEYKISQKKTVIINGINTCIDTYNKTNFIK